MKQLTPSPHHPTTPSLHGRIALITGASRGIGQAVAVRFAAEGARVILCARGEKGLTDTDDKIRAQGGEATLVPIDLADAGAIARLAQRVAARFGRIDVLVANAAMLGEIAPVAHSTPDEWNKTLALNVTAQMQLIRAFDPLLKQSASPRAIFVTSGVAESVHPYWNAYAVSKAALDMLVKLYAAENAKTALRANLVSPGAVATRMRAQAFPGEDPASLPSPDAITDVFVKLAGPDIMETGQVFSAQ